MAASAAPVQLTTSALNDVAPRWHPGGATIAYMKFDGGGNYQPGTVNINGTGEAFLATRVTRLYELWSELDPAAAREQSRAECQARVAALAEESRAHNWLHELH